MKGYNGIYIVGGYPDPEKFVEAALLGLESFDFLEVGVPFTDPVADGPAIARAAESVLEKGCTLAGILERVSEIRRRAGADKKIYLMTYANPVFGRGIGKFARAAKMAGVDGAILPDVPFVESARFKEPFRRAGLEYVHFVTPESTPEQVREISAEAEGFLYFVSIRGITGSALSLDAETRRKIALARTHSPVPVVLGFGIRDGANARAALDSADGFIIGTRIIELLAEGGEALAGFLGSLEKELGGK